MNPFKLLLAMLFGICSFGIVEGGGGGAAEALEEPGDGAIEPVADDAPDEGDSKPGDDEEGEIVISLGDEAPADEDEDEEAIAAALGDDQLKSAAWARMRVQKKELQRQTRDQAQKLRDLEAKVAAAKPVEQPVVLGPKPVLKAFADEEEIAQHDKDIDAWYARKAEVENVQRKQTKAAEDEQAKWVARLQDVDQETSKLKVSDRKVSEQNFDEIFAPMQRGLILGAFDAKTSALLRYALGTNPKKARELAAIPDTAKFIVAIADLRRDMKVTPRKAPIPDTPVRSNVAGAAAVDNQKERLRDEARRTGDYTKVAEFTRQQAKKQRKAA